MTVLVDVNVLLYAKFDDFPKHEVSRSWLEERIRSLEPVGIPWLTRIGFLRISTNRRVFDRPLSAHEAMLQLSRWTAAPNVWSPEPRERFQSHFSTLTTETVGNLVPDAWLGALAMEHGLTVISWDSDFARFDGVRVRAPEQSRSAREPLNNTA